MEELTNKYVIITNGNEIRESDRYRKPILKKAKKYIKKGMYTEIWYYYNKEKRTLVYYWN